LSLNRFLTAFIVLVGILSAQLPQAIEDIIYKSKVSKSNLGILITNRTTGEIVASLNEDKEFKPASTTKTATCYTALSLLGTNFRWPTQIFYTGRLSRGVLNGDLVVKAYGDPTLTTYNVRMFAKRLAGYGIRKITGNMIIDRSFFNVADRINSGFDKNFVSEYNAMPDALMLNDHLCSIKIVPKPGKIEAYAVSGDRSFNVINHIRAVNSACRGKNAWPRVHFLKRSDRVDVVLDGTLSTKCRPFAISKVLSKPYKSFYYIFKNALNSEGIEFNGKLILAKKPKGAKLMFTHYSRPLIKIVAKTLKKSNNLYARHIFLLDGAKLAGAPASVQKSQIAVKNYLIQKGLLTNSDIIVNGSGLSRKTRLSAASLSRVLDAAYNEFGNQWLNALSIAGVDGTLKKRFRYSIVKNRAFMKTGTLKDAKSIAGFVKSLNGNLYNAVIIYNGPRIWLGKDIQDKIITWLVRH